MTQNGPGKKPDTSDDGFADSADTGDSGPAEKQAPDPAWLESGEGAAMFAESAMDPDAPAFEVRTPESDGGAVEMQELARDPATDAAADAYAVDDAAMSGVEAPVLAEASEAPDPYEFHDDGSEPATSWVEAESLPSWHRDDDPPASKPASPPPAKGAPPSKSAPPAKPTAPPKPQATPAPKPTAPPRPAAPTPAKQPAASAPAKPAAAPAPKPVAAAPKPTATPAPKPTATPKPTAPTPAPSTAPAVDKRPSRSKGGLDLDGLFNRAKEIKDDPKKKNPG